MSAIEVLSAATQAACLRDLPGIDTGRHPDYVAEQKYLDSLSVEQKESYYKEKARLGDDNEDFFKERGIPTAVATRRPTLADCKVTLFFQLWEGESLGYDEPHRMDEEVFTPSYTAIVTLNNVDCAAVYFGGGELAYLVERKKQDREWIRCVANQHMPSQSQAREMGWISG